MMKKYIREFKILAFAYSFLIVLGVLHYVNSPILREIKHYDFVLYIITGSIIATVIVLLLSKCKKIDAIFSYLRGKFSLLKKDKIILLLIIVVPLILIVASLTAEVIMSKLFFSSQFIWQRSLFVFTFLLTVLIIYYFRGKPARIFLCMSLSIGALFAITMPIAPNSWDEETHYPWALQHSSIYSTYFTQADHSVRSIRQEHFFDKALRDSQLGAYNENGKLFSHIVEKDLARSYMLIGHIPSGIAIFLGRSFGLAWSVVFILGRLGNMVVYSIVVYFAIKRIKYGKYIVSIIGLLPSAVFLASNYTYDNWLISWIILGFSYFIAELQEPDNKAEKKNLVIMLLAFLIGLGPKPVYFPLMFVLYFIGKGKFKTPEHYRYYKCILTVSILFVVSSIVLPFILFTDNFSDQRGGEGVDAVAQISWILSNPISYIEILIGFLSNYLSPATAEEYLASFALRGTVKRDFAIMVVFITAVVITDENRHPEKISIKLRATMLLYCLVTVALISTTMYLAFTPVGSHIITGVQSRYTLPFVCPALLFIKGWNVNRYLERHYSTLVFGVSAYFLLSTLFGGYIIKYH